MAVAQLPPPSTAMFPNSFMSAKLHIKLVITNHSADFFAENAEKFIFFMLVTFSVFNLLFKFRVFFAQAQAQAEQSSYNKGQENNA